MFFTVFILFLVNEFLLFVLQNPNHSCKLSRFDFKTRKQNWPDHNTHPKIHLETLVSKMVTKLSYGLSWPDDVFIVLLHFNNVWRRVRYSKVRLVYHRPHNWRFCYPYHPPKKGADRNLVTLCYTVPRSTIVYQDQG